jgi:hypothetical protein
VKAIELSKEPATSFPCERRWNHWKKWRALSAVQLQEIRTPIFEDTAVRPRRGTETIRLQGDYTFEDVPAVLPCARQTDSVSVPTSSIALISFGLQKLYYIGPSSARTSQKGRVAVLVGGGLGQSPPGPEYRDRSTILSVLDWKIHCSSIVGCRSASKLSRKLREGGRDDRQCAACRQRGTQPSARVVARFPEAHHRRAASDLDSSAKRADHFDA